MQASNVRLPTDLAVPNEKPSADGNRHIDSIPEDRGTQHREKDVRAAASVGSTRAEPERRAPEPPGRTRPPAAAPATLWQSDDA